MKKVLLFTSSRADYGILENLSNKLLKEKLSLIYFLTGSHLLSDYGKTVKDINFSRKRIIKINVNLETNTKCSTLDNAKAFFVKFSNALKRNKPDYCIVLGDRYETLIFTQCAFFLNIPIIHFCGGDITLGSYDNIYRNQISLMSKFHFVTNNSSKKNLVHLLGTKKNIYDHGHIALDCISRINYSNREELCTKYNLDKKKKIILVTYHPDKFENKKLHNLSLLLEAIKKINENVIFTGSNIDYLGNQINQNIQKFCKNKKNLFYVKSLGKSDFFSFLNCSDLFISNSSSGYYEAPSFGLPIIDLGLRQKGRIKSKNITNVNFNKKKILNEINKKLNIKVQKKCIQNPYYKKNSVNNIVKQLRKIIK